MTRPIKVLFYGDSYSGTSGYSRVIKNLSTRLAADDKFDVYVQSIVSSIPSYVDNKVKILPALGNRGSEQFFVSILNHLKLLSPDIIIPICDPFLLVRDKLHLINYSNVKLIPYVPMDSIGVPDTSDEILSKANMIFTMSEYGKEMLSDKYDNVKTLYHGVNHKKFHPVTKDKQESFKKKLGYKKDDKLFFVIGRNFLRKRHNRFIEAVALLNETYPQNKAKFLCHISNLELDGWSLSTFIKRMEKQYDVTLDNIQFTEDHKLGSGLKEEELIGMFKAADFYLSATSGEGFGMPAVEAMACGKVCILPKNTTAHEFCEDDRCLLVDNEGFQNTGFGTQQELVDIPHLMGKIDQALNMSEEEYELKSKKAIEFAQEKCDWNKITEQLKEHLYEVLK